MSTGLQTLNGQNTLAKWNERITACRSSGLTVKAWCQENGVSPGSYYRWQRRLYELSTVQTKRAEFAEVPLGKRGTAVAVLHLPGGDVEVLTGADEETLRTVCRVLRHAE